VADQITPEVRESVVQAYKPIFNAPTPLRGDVGGKGCEMHL